MAAERISPSVMPYAGMSPSMNNEHDRAGRAELARRVARLCRGVLVEDGETATASASAGHFLIPNDVLLTDEAAAMGIHSEAHLLGGVVPARFVATKAISHGLLTEDAQVPAAWVPGLAARLGNCVLRGFTVFSAADAAAAGRLMLAHGPVRLKDVEGTSGRDQWVVEDAAALDDRIAAIDPDRLAITGLVIEENLVDVVTYSVGTVRLFDQSIAYWGTQRLTLNNHGEQVYGGSQLHCVRGGFAALHGLTLALELAEVISKAERYDRAVFAAYPALFASRRNYDVVVGCDPAGRRRAGVLEQSWRVGGASGAELLAFEAFAADPARDRIDCATVEIYGSVDMAPPGAALYYSGVDPVAGPITKYAVET